MCGSESLSKPYDLTSKFLVVHNVDDVSLTHGHRDCGWYCSSHVEMNQIRKNKAKYEHLKFSDEVLFTFAVVLVIYDCSEGTVRLNISSIFPSNSINIIMHIIFS